MQSCANTSECGIVTVRDSYTIEIARSIADTVEELLGARPYLVINNLNRSGDKARQYRVTQHSRLQCWLG